MVQAIRAMIRSGVQPDRVLGAVLRRKELEGIVIPPKDRAEIVMLLTARM